MDPSTHRVAFLGVKSSWLSGNVHVVPARDAQLAEQDKGLLLIRCPRWMPHKSCCERRKKPQFGIAKIRSRGAHWTKLCAQKKALEGARQAEHQGKAPSTQAAEFVREEIEHIREVSWNKNRLNLDWQQSANFGFLFTDSKSNQRSLPQ